MLYSTQAIENVFNSGLVAEDKLFVEYNLMSVEIIQDILKGNFKRQYRTQAPSACHLGRSARKCKRGAHKYPVGRYIKRRI